MCYYMAKMWRKGRPKHVEHYVVFNKHNTARVATCLFIKYYTNLHSLSYLAQFFLEWEMFHTKVVEKIKTHILFL